MKRNIKGTLIGRRKRFYLSVTNTDDLKRLITQDNLLADNIRVTIEFFSPQLLAQNNDCLVPLYDCRRRAHDQEIALAG
jgi:hypothetical protein